MTISSATTKNLYTGNGATTVFAYQFKILSQSEITVQVDGVTKTITTDYTVSGVGNNAGGNITFITAPANATSIALLPNPSYLQETDYNELDPFPAEAHEEGLDRAAIRDLALKERIDRSVTLPADVSGVSVELPAPVANQLIGWNSGATALTNKALADISTSLDAVFSSLTNGDLIRWNGTNWVNVATLGNSNLASKVVGENILINGDFQFDQRNGGASTAISDDVYCFDRWYALTQTASVNASQLTLQDTNQPYALRLTQNQATAQRMGIAQIVEARHSQALRGQSVTFSGRINYSNAAAVRYAILEWTGAADSVTSDVVNSWTNATYTAGNFFLGSNLTVASVGSITPTASTWTDLTALTATISSSCNNLIVFIWTEGTAAQNSTLDCGKLKAEVGAFATPFIPDNTSVALAKCQRYYFKQTYGHYWLSGATDTNSMQFNFPVSMRAAPTLALSGGITTNLASESFNETDTNGTRYSMTATAAGYVSAYSRILTAVIEL